MTRRPEWLHQLAKDVTGDEYDFEDTFVILWFVTLPVQLMICMALVTFFVPQVQPHITTTTQQ